MISVIASVPDDLYDEFFAASDDRRLRTAAAALGGDFERCADLSSASDAARARVVVTAWGARPFDAAVLDRFPRLELVAHTGASVKAFVTPELFERGVRVTQAGQGMARSVAEVSLTFTLSLLHRVSEMHAQIVAGGWYDASRIGVQHEIFGSTIAVIGASRTGRCYIDLVRALGARVLVVDPTLTAGDAAGLGCELSSLDDALRRAQIVALHAPTLPATHHLLGARELALMPDGAGLVNTARSWLVDEVALLTELSSGRISAALDVFDAEPLDAQSALRSLPNVLLTPHRAAGTREGRLRQGSVIADEVEAFAEGRPLQHAVGPTRLTAMG